jgi:hypothetical protein
MFCVEARYCLVFVGVIFPQYAQTRQYLISTHSQITNGMIFSAKPCIALFTQKLLL